jgi:hypothetical protein
MFDVYQALVITGARLHFREQWYGAETEPHLKVARAPRAALGASLRLAAGYWLGQLQSRTHSIREVPLAGRTLAVRRSDHRRPVPNP